MSQKNSNQNFLTKHFSDVSHNAINRTGQESGTAASNFEPAIRTVVKITQEYIFQSLNRLTQ